MRSRLETRDGQLSKKQNLNELIMSNIRRLNNPASGSGNARKLQEFTVSGSEDSNNGKQLILVSNTPKNDRKKNARIKLARKRREKIMLKLINESFQFSEYCTDKSFVDEHDQELKDHFAEQSKLQDDEGKFCAIFNGNMSLDLESIED